MSEQIVNITVAQTAQAVEIVVTPPVQKVINITVTQGSGGGGSIPVLFGEKKTGIDVGVSPSFSFTDDYLYVCVQSGDAASAIWKKTLLFHT